jgi:precorrin isomerase
MTVLLSCVCVLQVADHHGLHISFVISTPVSVIKKSELKKRRKKERIEFIKKQRTSEN